MGKYFVLNILFAALLIMKGSTACFQGDTEDEQYIQVGSPFLYQCQCTEPDYTADDLRWVDKSGEILKQSGPGTGSMIYTEEQSNALDLFIPNVSKTMTGTYKCIANFNGANYIQTLNLYVYDPVMFVNTPTEQYLKQGFDSLIECHAVGDYNPAISWYKEYTEIDYNSGKYLQLPNGLLVRNVTKEDAFIYKCSANQMRVGAEVDKDIRVEVMTIPVITELFAMPGQTVVAGTSLKIKCVAEGWPNIHYSWNKTPADLGVFDNVTWTQLDNIIVFEEIRPEDRGIYECKAFNNVGFAVSSITIDVLVGPEIINFTDITAVEGQDIPIFCNATGRPEPDVTIVFQRKNSTEDKSDSEYEEVIQNLLIMRVSRSDEGFYVCNASNDVDFETEKMYLKVHHPPYFKNTMRQQRVWGWNGQSVNLSCAHESSPTANVTWRYEKGNATIDESSRINSMLNAAGNIVENIFLIQEGFSPYGIYMCFVVNQYGRAVRTFELVKGYPPSEVQNASIIEVTASTATFYIETPTNYTGPDVIGFRAEYDEAANYIITNIHLNRTWSLDRPFKLERLKPNTTYLVRFAAVNLVETGKWSEMIEFDTLERSAPEPPIWSEQPLKVVSSKHLLTWTAPYDNGEPIDYYVLQYCPVYDRQLQELCKSTTIPPSTELELRNLEHNTTYHLELVAHNSEGNSSTAVIWINVPAMSSEQLPFLPIAAIIGISVIVVAICLLILDLLLFFWRRQGIIANCCHKKNKKKMTSNLNSRDKKGLLRDNRETTAEDTLTRPNNGHKEYEYNKTTGVITGKHSSV